MKKILLISLLLTSTLLVGCNQNKTQETDLEVCELNQSYACTETEEKSETPDTEIDTAKAILLSLKENNLLTLASFVGPKGLRFSPYAYVNMETDIILSSGEIYYGLADSRSFTWGSYDGSGEPIDLGIEQYFEKFVYDIDFFNAPEIIENQEIMRGNIINNVFDIYTGAYIIEFYIPGIDPQYEGMDRRSLILVLEKTDENRYLIGIIHNQWTI